jgi:uncharacterized protein (DUF2141 family)
MRPPSLLLALPVLVVGSLLGAPRADADEPAAADAAKAAAPAVRFNFSELRGGGVVRCALYKNDAEHMKRSHLEVIGKVEGGRAVCVFANVAPGTYSGGAFHDANDNGKLDTNWIGIPKEGVASSNNAKGRMGPPKFKDASFDYRGGVFSQDLRMKYF